MKVIERTDINEILANIDLKAIEGKSFLITGATGSLARYIALVLCTVFSRTNSIGGKVVILARNRVKAERIFAEYWNEDFFEYVEASVEEFTHYSGQIDFIVHAACVSNTAFFYSNPVEVDSANVIGTFNLLKIAKEKKVSGFLFLSSGAVFGGAIPDCGIYLGMDPQRIENCYGISKLAGENLCSGFYHEYGVPTKVVRIGYTYGPHVDLNDGHLYSDFIKSILNYEDLDIKGDGQTTMGLCYVTDAVRAFFMILLKGKNNTPYLMLNYKNPMTIEEIARRLTEVVFPERNLSYRLFRNNGKANKENWVVPKDLRALGWEPMIDLDTGFKRVVRCLEEKESLC